MDEDFLGSEPGIEDALDAYLKSKPKMLDKDGNPLEVEEEEAPEKEVEETSEEEGEEEGSEESEEEGEEEGSEEKPKSKSADDEDEVSVSVDGKELKVKVKDLKRLYGQEASLTQKSQAVSNAHKAIETQGLQVAKILDARIKAAESKYAKYADVDLFKAQRELEPEEFDALRSAQKASKEELDALRAEADTFIAESLKTRQELIRAKAKLALPKIKEAIPEWNDKLYEELRLYAVGQGFDKDDINELVDPSAIVMIRKAMLFDAAKAKTENVTKKVIKAPKAVLKKGDKPSDTASVKLKQARRQAATTGDIDDIAALYLASKKNN